MRSTIVLFAVLALFSLTKAQTYDAISNGNFTDGLADWTVVPSGSATVNNDVAVLNVYVLHQPAATIAQTVTLPYNAIDVVLTVVISGGTTQVSVNGQNFGTLSLAQGQQSNTQTFPVEPTTIGTLDSVEILLESTGTKTTANINSVMLTYMLGATTAAPTTIPPTTMAPTLPATTMAPTTMSPTTMAPTTMSPTTMAPTTMPATTMSPTTMAPTTSAPATSQHCSRNFVGPNNPYNPSGVNGPYNPAGPSNCDQPYGPDNGQNPSNPVGPNNPSGPTGPTGGNGPNNANGPDNANGPNNANGPSNFNGPNNFNGPDGFTGANNPSH